MLTDSRVQFVYRRANIPCVSCRVRASTELSSLDLILYTPSVRSTAPVPRGEFLPDVVRSINDQQQVTSSQSREKKLASSVSRVSRNTSPT